MPIFEPFRGVRYSEPTDVGLVRLTSPPYDVFDAEERGRFARETRNIVHVDYPLESEGPGRYEAAARTLEDWIAAGVLVRDATPTLSIYRMEFIDASGRRRTTVGVIGALEVVDEGGRGVLPHEQTTPKAKSDRLDLMRATRANLSPVWGLSLTPGLSALLTEPGDETGRLVDEDGVLHVIERVDDADRIASISAAVSSSAVLIADGHHRYAVSRTYRDEVRAQGGPLGAETTMTLVQELVEEQLAVAAIHRLYDVPGADLVAALSHHYDATPADRLDDDVLSEMDSRRALAVLDRGDRVTWLTEKAGVFDGVRAIDSLRLETALHPHGITPRYQHGFDSVRAALARGEAASAILIRPVSLAEIDMTARTGTLMPPKSTFFTPKPRTGLVLRLLDP